MLSREAANINYIVFGLIGAPGSNCQYQIISSPKLYMNPTKNLIEPKLYMNLTKNLIEPKLYRRKNKDQKTKNGKVILN